MSKHSEEIIINKDISSVFELCQEAAANLQWRVMSVSENQSLVIKEVAVQATSYNWPAEISVDLSSTKGGTRVQITSKVFGFGPIQYGHAKGQAGNFINQLQVCVRRPSKNSNSPTNVNIQDELLKLANLYKMGVLNDSEFALAKKKLLGS